MIQNNNNNNNHHPNKDNNNNSMEAEYQRLIAKLVPKLRLPSSADDEPSSSSSSAFSQYWIGVAGGPGSGKSTVTARVAQRLNDIYSQHMRNTNNKGDAVALLPSPPPPVAVVIPMDGWHIPQQELIAKFGMDGMRRRGAPDTFDAARMIEELTAAKELGMGTFPIYSREISDPVRNADDPSCCCTLTHDHRIVFVEGLYVLMHEEEDPAWHPLTKLWDESWYVEAPSRDVQIERLVRRSLKTWSPKKDMLWGPSRIGAEKKVETIDIPNMDWVERSKQYANEIIVTR